MYYVSKGKAKLVGNPFYALEVPNKRNDVPSSLLIDIYTIRPDPRKILKKGKQYECTVIYVSMNAVINRNDIIFRPYKISVKDNGLKEYIVFNIV